MCDDVTGGVQPGINSLNLLNLTQCRLLSGSKTIASVTCKLNFEKVNILDLRPGNTIHTNNFSLRKIGCGKCNIIPFNVITIDRFHCHTINMAQKKIGNRPVEEAKKMKRYIRVIYICPSLRSMLPTVSELFAETFHAPL